MCVIVAKEKNKKMPTRETLKKCFSKNPHGCGFMYAENNRVYIEKGFMDFDSFYQRILELDQQIDLTKNSIVMHFRISTSGNIDSGNCHPYPITNNLRLTRETFIQCSDVAFCHNGIIHDYSPKGKSLYNDTQIFNANVLYLFKNKYPTFYKDRRIMKMLDILCKSKLCFLDNKGDIYCVGKFFKRDEVLYSNLNFIETKIKPNFYNYENKFNDDLFF